MDNNDYDTGISSEVFTVKSNIRLIDIFNLILEKKAKVVLCLFNKLNYDGIINKESSIVIIGTTRATLNVPDVEFGRYTLFPPYSTRAV